MTLQSKFPNQKAIKYMLLRIMCCGIVCFGEGMVPGTGYVAQQYWTKRTDITQFCTLYIWRSRQCRESLLGSWLHTISVYTIQDITKLMLCNLPGLNNFLPECSGEEQNIRPRNHKNL
jgi:hypothetical protein